MLPLIARTFFRVQEQMLGRRTFALLKEQERAQSWPRERLEELQLRKLQSVVAKAYDHTPYWRAVMDDAGLGPADVGALSDLWQFPLLDKETIRARREDMVWRENRRRLMVVRTRARF